MAKIDLKKQLSQLYRPSAKEVSLVDVPAMNFLAIDGRGDPNEAPAYAAAVEALFALSYALKFAVKKGSDAVDYSVMPLEGLWWADDMAAYTEVDHTEVDRSRWLWRMMIMQPAVITPDLVTVTTRVVAEKKDLPALASVRFESFAEGTCAQIMHVGPFSAEGPTIAHVHRFIAEQGRELRGRHHEIYLSDIRRADPAKWRTVIRQPLG